MELTEGAREGLGEGARAHEARGVLLQVCVAGSRVALRRSRRISGRTAAADRAFGDGKFNGARATPCPRRRLPPPRAAGSGSRGPRARDHAAFPDEVARFSR